jgi:hypothetical protein
MDAGNIALAGTTAGGVVDDDVDRAERLERLRRDRSSAGLGARVAGEEVGVGGGRRARRARGGDDVGAGVVRQNITSSFQKPNMNASLLSISVTSTRPSTRSS